MGAAERWYRNLAFRKKVWISFLAVSLIPVIILGAFSYFQTRKLLVQREQEVLSETLKQSVLTLNATLESCEHIMENIVWDSLIKQALEKQYTSNYEMYLSYRDVIDPAFLRIKSLNPQVKSITIYSSNSTLYAGAAAGGDRGLPDPLGGFSRRRFGALLRNLYPPGRTAECGAYLCGYGENLWLSDRAVCGKLRGTDYG